MMHTFNSKYGIGDLVYLITDPEQNVNIITEVSFDPGNKPLYTVSLGGSYSKVYEIEVSSEANESIRLGLVNKEQN